MLRKKLISLGLVGITTFGAIASNAAIVIASPNNTESSDTMMQEAIHKRMNRIEKYINKGNSKRALNLQKQLKSQLKVLSDIEEDTAYLQNEFNSISDQIK